MVYASGALTASKQELNAQAQAENTITNSILILFNFFNSKTNLKFQLNTLAA